MNEKQYIDLYREHRELLERNSAACLNRGREEAAEWLERHGLPTRRHESYLYCPLMEEMGRDYGVNVARVKFPVNPHDVFKCNVPGIHANVYFIVNDQFYANSHPELGGGAVFCSMKTAEERFPEIVGCYAGRLTDDREDAFVAMNRMLAQDGYFLYVPKGVKVELPVQVVNIMRSDVDYMATAHNLIVVEEGAEVTALVCDHTIDRVSFFANRMTEAYVGRGAHLRYYTMESSHDTMNNLNQLYVKQEGDSEFTMCTVGLHNGKTRNYTEVYLDGEGAAATLGGMLISDGAQHSENQTLIYHNAPRCTSYELFKYRLDEQSEGVFAGRTIVKEGAQKTVAQQTNRNICLTREAHMWAKPQLEIYADDVKCGHGATTGQLDEQAMFYMRTRGIGETEARMLLLMAFTADVIDLVEFKALRERIRALVEKRLRGEAAHCEGCRTVR